MKLIVVAQDSPDDFGGVQTYTRQMALHVAQNHRVTVLAPSAQWLGDAEKPKGLTLVSPSVGGVLFNLGASAQLSRVAQQEGARVAFHGHYANALGSLNAKRSGAIDRYYIAVHGAELLRRPFGQMQDVYRDMLLRNADGLFPVSRYTRDLLLSRGMDESKIHVIPNGVDVEQFSPRDPLEVRERYRLQGNRVLLSVCKLEEAMGLQTALDAFDRLADRYPDLVYLIAGEGKDRSVIMLRAEERVRRGQVRFLGKVSDHLLPDLYSLADLFMLPARVEDLGNVEGFGLRFLEANACGTPVVGTRSGGVEDAIEHGVNGLLVEPGDAPAMARALEQLLRSEEQRRKLSKSGLKRARWFRWEGLAQQMVDVMEQAG